MPASSISRRAALTGVSASSALAVTARHAKALGTKLIFLTDWFAEAEHGGFYQAKATSLYEKAGLDVTVRMGGTQVNTMQLLLSDAAQIIMGQDIQILNSIANSLPVTTVATSFQFSLQGMLTHDNIKSLAELKGHKILIGGSARVTFWPWLKARYGFTEDMAGVNTFNLQPFLVDPSVAMQAYPSEVYVAETANAKTNFFLFADEGYPPYGSTMVTTNDFVTKNPDVVKTFVRCSLEGWRDYMRDPAPGNQLIKEANPKMTDGLLAFAWHKMKAMHVLDRGAAATVGIGTMTADRWQQTYEFLVKADLLKSSVDWRRAFTTRFTDDLKLTL